MPEFTAETAGMGTLRLLEAIRTAELADPLLPGGQLRDVRPGPGDAAERDDAVPSAQPYAVAKVFAHWMTVHYREAYGMLACNGILFNHESPRRGGTFVTRKITRAVARSSRASSELVYLGNLDAQRDWGYAKEYVEAMWLMLQQPEPDDYVVATGEMHSVRELCELAFGPVGPRLGGARRVDPRYFRPTEVDELCGDATKARERLGWTPRTTFHELVRLMLAADLTEAGVDIGRFPRSRA